MPGQRKRELWTNREVILSSDLTRIGKLANMEMQNAEELRAMRNDAYLPATNTFDDFTGSAKGAAMTAIFGLIRAPSIDAIGSTFNVTLGAGEGHVVGAGTIPADESEYQLVRWAEQVLAWPLEGQPNPSNPRICLIVATPADVAAESQSRQILVNPDTREMSPDTVYKLSAPVATITVLAGDAAAAPVPPSCPAGSLPLFEVVVPAGATDSAEYSFIRRSWRRIEFPGTSQHGIVHGCVPDLIGTTFTGIPEGSHRLVIDGELLSWNHTQTLSNTVDQSNTPGTAPGTHDLPTYLYLCGGRATPLRCQGTHPAPGAGGTWAPVMLVESLTAPDSFGYPTADLSISWGSGTISIARASACYIGLHFRAAGTTNNVPVVYDGDWLYFQVQGIPTLPVFCAKNPFVVTSGAYVSTTLSSLPAISTAGIVVGVQGAISGGGVSYTKFAAGGSEDSYMFASVQTTVGTQTLVSPPVTLGRNNLSALAISTDAGVGVSLAILATAFNMNIPRLAR